MEKILAAFFPPKDQIKAIGMKRKPGMRWGNNTIRNAMKLNFATGSTGNRLLKDMEILLLDISTLQRRLQHIQFDMLRLKVNGLTDGEGVCADSGCDGHNTKCATAPGDREALWGRDVIRPHRSSNTLIFLLWQGPRHNGSK